MGGENLHKSQRQLREYNRMLARKQVYTNKLELLRFQAAEKYANAKKAGATEEVLNTLRVQKKQPSAYELYLQRMINRNDPEKRVLRIDQN